jgi:hypothetical protein
MRSLVSWAGRVACGSLVFGMWACDWGSSTPSGVIVPGGSLPDASPILPEDAGAAVDATIATDGAATTDATAPNRDANGDGETASPIADASTDGDASAALPVPPSCDPSDAGDAGPAVPSRVVTNGNDTGAGSLRAAIAASAAGDVIGFAAGVTQVQLATELDIAIPLTIQGPGSASLAIEGGNLAPAIRTTGNPVTLSGVTVRHASIAITAAGGGLEVRDSVLDDNTAFGLSVSPPTNGTVIARVCGTLFANNAVGAMANPIASGATSAIYLANSFLTGNATGAEALLSTAGQAAQVILNGGTRVSGNTQYGILVEDDPGDAGVGFASFVAPATGGLGTNLVTGNPVGVRRIGDVPNSGIAVAPLSQITGNTVDFSPAWP